MFAAASDTCGSRGSLRPWNRALLGPLMIRGPLSAPLPKGGSSPSGHDPCRRFRQALGASGTQEVLCNAGPGLRSDLTRKTAPARVRGAEAGRRSGPLARPGVRPERRSAPGKPPPQPVSQRPEVAIGHSPDSIPRRRKMQPEHETKKACQLKNTNRISLSNQYDSLLITCVQLF